MFERRIRKLASGGIYDDHETNRHPSENIQGEESLFWRSSHYLKFRSCLLTRASEFLINEDRKKPDFFFEIKQLTELASMSRKIIYLLNPISGTRKKSRVKELIIRKTREAGFDFDILPSNPEGQYDYLRQTIRREAITDVVICGGDGTVNAVVNALRMEPVHFGIIPMGSGNGLALAARIPKNTGHALDLIFSGEARPVDAFYINEKFSCMLCGIGFDAAVAHEFAKQKKRGLQTYIRISTKEFFKSKPYPFEILLKDQVLYTDAFFISIANSNQFGNNFTIAPRASLSDGLLDIVIVKRMNKFSLPFSVLHHVAGNNLPLPVSDFGSKKNIIYLQADKITIRNPALAPLHIDGDPADTCPEFIFRVVPNCFQLIQP
jgi:diacylglycerol kinase (ATP)